MPSPVPLALDVIDSHDALLVADQAQSSIVATVNGPAAPPPEPIDTEVGLTKYEHDAEFRPCVIVTICPATVSVPVRDAPPLEETLNVNVPEPLPLVRPVSEIHDALLLADHSHPDGAVIDVDNPLVAAGDTEIVRGDTVKLPQLAAGDGTAPWLIVTDWPAITSDAERGLPEFGAAVKLTVPGPVPVAPAVIAIHVSSERALHAHAAVALTVMLPVPPEDGTAWRVEESSNRQEAAS